MRPRIPPSQQSARYRQRVRERVKAQQAAAEQAGQAQREGEHTAEESEKSASARPGCYELFVPARRSPAPAVLLLLVPQGFTTSDPAQAALGTAAEAVGVESSPDTAVAEESTSPRIVGPWHAGLSWFTVSRESCQRFYQAESCRERG